MGFVDNMVFKNARATFLSFEIEQGGQCFLVGFRKVSPRLPKGCGSRAVGPGPYFMKRPLPHKAQCGCFTIHHYSLWHFL